MGPRRKSALIISDGLGDRPVPEFKHQTPLEWTRHPSLDRMATHGVSGLMYPIRMGVVAGSDTAHLSILGYDPFAVYTGRGPFEAAGIGMDVRRGDVAFRVNFATVGDNMVVLDRRAGRIEKDTDQLAAALNGLEIEGVEVYFKESVAHRAALVLRGEGLGHQVTDVDPHATGVPVLIAQALAPDSEKTARVLNAFVAESFEILSQHPINKERRAGGLLPANIALPRGVGIAPHIEPFRERYHIGGACVVETGLIEGIGVYLGMDVVDVPTATGGLDTDVRSMLEAVAASLKDHDFVLCNIKGTDVAGHDGRFEAKAEMIRRIDESLGWLLAHISGETYVAVTGDHATPVEVGDHTGDAVPFVLYGPSLCTDEVTVFHERAAARGALGTFCGVDVLPYLTNLMGVQPKFGA